MGFFATLFKDAEEPAIQTKTGINAILLGPPGSGKGTQVSGDDSETRTSSVCYVMCDMRLLRRQTATDDLLCCAFVRSCVCEV